MHVPGTTASVEDTAGGVAIVFKTTGDVAELRGRVHHMAEMHNSHQMGGMMNDTRGDATGSPTPMGGGMMASNAIAEDVAGGARIVLTPKDPSQLATLRSDARAHVEKMSRGECPQMNQPTGNDEGR